MRGTEMRVGMRSDEWGAISISTIVSQDGVAAQIALDHAALSQALTAHVPGMEAQLGGSLGVPARVEVRDASMFGSGGGGAQSGGETPQQQGGRSSSNESSGAISSGAMQAATGYALNTTVGTTYGSGSERLSIRA